jgi:hypothetical protein
MFVKLEPVILKKNISKIYLVHLYAFKCFITCFQTQLCVCAVQEKKKIQVNEREVVWRVLLTPSPDFSQVAMSAALPIICIKVSANLYGV